MTMYLKSLPWYLSIALSMMIVYGIYAGPPAAVSVRFGGFVV